MLVYQFVVVFSVLGRIIRVTDEVTAYRQWIADNFQPPTLDYELSLADADAAMSDKSSTSSSSGLEHCENKSSYANIVSQQNAANKRYVQPTGSNSTSDSPTS